jgi:hypothetical protein
MSCKRVVVIFIGNLDLEFRIFWDDGLILVKSEVILECDFVDFDELGSFSSLGQFGLDLLYRGILILSFLNFLEPGFFLGICIDLTDLMRF